MNQIDVKHIVPDLKMSTVDDQIWSKAKSIRIDTYWSGKAAPKGRGFAVKMLWSDNALYVRFAADQTEPLIINEVTDTTKKTDKLWNNDVCEIFIAHDPNAPNKYFEFEAAPTGEWLDVAIELLPHERKADWKFSSGMTTTAKIEDDSTTTVVKIPFTAFKKTPRSGDVWLGNLLRCVGRDPDRGYLTWRPTKTAKPNFHVPKVFGEFRFVK